MSGDRPPALSDAERGRQRDALRVARVRVLALLQATCNRHRRASLEMALADLDARLLELDAE